MSRKLLILGVMGIGLAAFFVGVTTTGALDSVLNPIINTVFFGENEQLRTIATVAKLDAALPVGRDVRDDDVVAYEATRHLLTAEEKETVTAWFKDKNIQLVGVKKEPRTMYDTGLDSNNDVVDILTVPGVWEVYAALSLLPDSQLELMGGKVIYVSLAAGRPYTVIKGDTGGVLQHVKAGFIQTQPISKDSVLRELAHIITFHGIEGLSDDKQELFIKLMDEYSRLFDIGDKTYKPGEVPKGFISAYATQSRVDNLAEHFRYYVLKADEFRGKASDDADLARKYIFFRDRLFEGKEY